MNHRERFAIFGAAIGLTLTSVTFLAHSARGESHTSGGQQNVASFEEHAVLTQLHRWYLYYENDDYTMDNQLKILDPEVVIRSTRTSVGHDAYREAVSLIPKSWENAHHVISTKVTKQGGVYQLEADIIYQNLGIRPDVRAAKIHYSAKLSPVAGSLPVFTEINLQQNGETLAGDFSNAFSKNRSRSLVHNWMSLVENPNAKAEAFAQLLDSEFALNFPSGPVSDSEGLSRWVKYARTSVASSQHVIRNFVVTPIAAGHYHVDFFTDWRGIDHQGGTHKMTTKHSWVVVDDPKGTFPKVKRMDVSLVE